MAVLVFYAKNHWLDSESIEEINKISLIKYEARYQRGDLFNVLEDEECPEAPSPNSAFVFVRITKDDGSRLPATKLKSLAIPYIKTEIINGNINQTIIRNRKIHINWEKLSTSIKNTLRNNREIKVTVTQIKNNIKLFDKQLFIETGNISEVNFASIITG